MFRKIVATKIGYVVSWSYEEDLPGAASRPSLQASTNDFFNGAQAGGEDHCEPRVGRGVGAPFLLQLG